MADIISILKEQAILKNLPESLLIRLSKAATEKTFLQEEILMSEGDTSNEIFFIKKGVVFVYNLLENGAIVPVATLHEGQSVGEMGVITNKVRSATVEALSDLEIVAITSDEFRAIMKSNYTLAEDLLKDLSGRIKDENALLRIQKEKHLPERAWTLLQELNRHFENNTINLSHEKLSQLAGVTRPRFTEALHTLVEEKKIKLSFNSVILL